MSSAMMGVKKRISSSNYSSIASFNQDLSSYNPSSKSNYNYTMPSFALKLYMLLFIASIHESSGQIHSVYLYISNLLILDTVLL